MSTGEFSSNLSKSTPLKRLQSGLASTLIMQVLKMVEAILLVPLFLRAWGADGYGEWLTLTAFIGYLMLADMGVQNYVGNLLAMSYAANDITGFKKQLSDVMSLLIFFFSSIMLIIFLGMMLPNITIPGINRSLTFEQRLIVIFMSVIYLTSIMSAVWSTTYNATGRYARGAMIGNVQGIIKLGVVVVALLLGAPPVLYVLLLLFIVFTGVILRLIDIRIRAPEARHIKISFRHAVQGRNHLGGSIFFWLRTLSNGINQQGVISVLAASLPASMVSLYATHRTASGLIRYPMALVLGPLFPELSILGGQQRTERLKAISLLATRVITFVSGLAALAVWVWLPTLYTAWTNDELELHPALLAMFLMQTVLFAGWSTIAWPLLATNQHRRIALWDIANAILTIILALILVGPFDIYGVAIATFIGDILCGFLVYPRLTAKSLHTSVRATYQAITDPLVALGAVAIVIGITGMFLDGWSFAVLSSLFVLLTIYPFSVLLFGKEFILGSCRMVLDSSPVGRFFSGQRS